eukprot:TRINITY_DN378_c0_g1_i1.p1 TRINITY_DN378_c0_g1~~TRINITY_DN378_c0_g1_i1.p1  ORF type:complete len:590 (+),score=81.99 TRINITY_DN378_c0_g1_i1:1039-2808(+)
MSSPTCAAREEGSGPTTPLTRPRRQTPGDSGAHTPPIRPLLPPGGISLPASVGGYGASQSTVGAPAPLLSLPFLGDRSASAAGASVGQATGAAEAEVGRDENLVVAPVRCDGDEDGHDSGNTSSSSSGSSGSSTGTGSGYVGRKRRAGGRLEPSRRPQSPGADSNSRGGSMDAEGSQDNLQEVFGTPPARRVGTPGGSPDRDDATAALALAGVVDVDAGHDGMVADNVAGGMSTPAPVVSSDDDDAEVPVRTLPARSAAAGCSGGAALRLPEAPLVSTMGGRRVADEHETTRRLLDLQMTGEQSAAGVESSSPSGASSSKRLRPWCNHDRAVMCEGPSACPAAQLSEPSALDDMVMSIPPSSADSVPAMVRDIRAMLDYVASKPSLAHCSASFMRDYLRTMLTSQMSAVDSERALHEDHLMVGVTPCPSEVTDDPSDATRALKLRPGGRRILRENLFARLPEEITKHVFSFLPGPELANVRLVSREWRTMADDEQLWKALTLARWRSLDKDAAAWPLISDVHFTDPHKWRKVYPHVARGAQWRCRLQKRAGSSATWWPTTLVVTSWQRAACPTPSLSSAASTCSIWTSS